MAINNMKSLTDTHYATLLLLLFFFFIELKPGH